VLPFVRIAALWALCALLGCKGGEREKAPPANVVRLPQARSAAQARIDTSPHVEPQDTWTGYRIWTASELGIGPVRVGMTFAQADSALGGRFAVGDSLDPGCDYANIQGVARAVHFLVGNGRIGRVDVRDSSVATSRGVRVGDPESRVLQLYPGTRATPHEYVDGHYLTVRPGAPRDTTHFIVFETDGRVVTKYRAGISPWVHYIEGCS
jgi:hypothetical protein